MKGKLLFTDHQFLFRCLAAPAMFIAAAARHPAARWCAAGILAVSLAAWICQAVRRKKDTASAARPCGKADGEEEKELRSTKMTGTELSLLRQVNYRITERLEKTYPSAAWLWAGRPSPEELASGGSWRIQLSNAEPYNFGEVSMEKNGAMSITLILAAPLRETRPVSPEAVPDDGADLRPEEELDRTDALTWYTEYGGDLLAGMIDDLNTQGHRKLTIHDDGEVFIETGEDRETAVDKLEWFLPRIAWPKFTELLKEDGITASEEEAGLVLTW